MFVDPRWPSFEFDFLDNTADNSSGALVAMGRFSHVDDPARLSVEFTDGSTTRSGVGSNAMGNPLDAVAWLIHSLAGEGTGIQRGDVVFTGGLASPLDVEPDTTYRWTPPASNLW